MPFTTLSLIAAGATCTVDDAQLVKRFFVVSEIAYTTKDGQAGTLPVGTHGIVTRESADKVEIQGVTPGNAKEVHGSVSAFTATRMVRARALPEGWLCVPALGTGGALGAFRPSIGTAGPWTPDAHEFNELLKKWLENNPEARRRLEGISLEPGSR